MKSGLQSLKSLSNKFEWTELGLIRLGKAIKYSLDYNRTINDRLAIKEGTRTTWEPDSLRSLADRLKISVSYVTLGAIVNASRKTLDLEVLKEIAPYVYRVKAFKVDNRSRVADVELDTDRTYRDDWRAFAQLGVDGYLLDSPIDGINSGIVISDREAEILRQAMLIIQKILPAEADGEKGGLIDLFAKRKMEDGIRFDSLTGLMEWIENSHGLEQLQAYSIEFKGESGLSRLQDIRNGAVPSDDEMPDLAASIRELTGSDRFTDEFLMHLVGRKINGNGEPCPNSH